MAGNRKRLSAEAGDGSGKRPRRSHKLAEVEQAEEGGEVEASDSGGLHTEVKLEPDGNMALDGVSESLQGKINTLVSGGDRHHPEDGAGRGI
jgi:hypothetical protein